MAIAYEDSPQRVYERRLAAINAKATPAGGFTRAQLAAWNVRWPPQHGWKQALVDQDVRAFRRFKLHPRQPMPDLLIASEA